MTAIPLQRDWAILTAGAPLVQPQCDFYSQLGYCLSRAGMRLSLSCGVPLDEQGEGRARLGRASGVLQ
jgi:hypothetical protein